MTVAVAGKPTTNAAAVAGRLDRVADQRLRPEDLPLDQEGREAWVAVTADEGILQHPVLETVRSVLHRLRRADARYAPEVAVAKLIVLLAAAGVKEWRLRQIPLFLERVIESCFAGKAQRSIDDIDRDEQQYESRETQLTLERRIAEARGTEVPSKALIEEAEINEAEAAIQLERARVLRRRERLLALKAPVYRIAAS